MSVFSEPCTDVVPSFRLQSNRPKNYYNSKNTWINSLKRNRKKIIGAIDKSPAPNTLGRFKKPDTAMSIAPSVFSFRTGAQQFESNDLDKEKPYKPYERKFTLQGEASNCRYFSTNDSNLGDSLDSQAQEIEKLHDQLSSAQKLITTLMKEKEMGFKN